MEDAFELELIQNPFKLATFLANNDTDLVLLDLHMPEIDGFTLYQNVIRDEYPGIPVIFITADHSEDALIKGMELGADDFITRPVAFNELIARVKNKIQKWKDCRYINSSNKITIDSFTLDCEMRMAKLCDRNVHLTPIEFKIIHLLAKNPNKVYSRNTIVDILWPNVHVQNQNMDTHLSNLRRKLHPFSDNIKTIKSKGYVLRV